MSEDAMILPRPDQTRPDQTVIHVRNSSFELLRITAILFIITFHLSYKSGFDFTEEPLVINRLWIQFTGMGESLGYVGNNIFLLISGFFLVKSRSIDWRRIFSLWVRLLFWSVVIFLLSVIFGGATVNFRNTLVAVMPLLSRRWWFLTYYVALYLLHPFLNEILCDLTQDSYRKFITVLSVTWGLILISNSKINLVHITDFICLYSIGGYIRLWDEDRDRRIYILYGVALMLMNYVLICLASKGNMILSSLVGKSIYPEKYLNAMTGVFNMGAAVCIFIGFRRLNIPYSKTINVIASAVTGVYMLHDHGVTVRFWWHYVFRASSFQGSPYLIPYTISAVLIVYVLCTVAELCRITLFKVLSHGRLS